MNQAVTGSAPALEIRTAQGDALSVNPLGATITLDLLGTPILTAVTRSDGKQGITHPCSPIFGPDVNGIYGLSQHGQMRISPTRVAKTADREITVLHNVTDAGFPIGIGVKQVLTLENSTFKLSYTHHNGGSQPAFVNGAEHCYFAAPQGHNGSTLNGQDVTTLMGESDSGVVVDLKPTNSIRIPGLPPLELVQQGFRTAALWVRKTDGGRDRDYLCIEPVEYDPILFGSPPTKIDPGASRTATFHISLERT
jgi:galactose mutarotase-like enzyme